MKLLRLILAIAASGALAVGADSPVEAWKTGVDLHPVSTTPGRHTIHSYFNTSPESPDGKWVLFYASKTHDGQSEGEIHIRNRETGEEQVLATGLHTEDAHRAACQQWMSNGQRVIFHDFKNDKPVVEVVDVATKKRRELARGMLVGFTPADSDVVPIYPPHWKTGADRRDLEMLNVVTGKTTPLVTAKATLQAFPKQIEKIFGNREIKLFFPMLSPNHELLYYKLATPTSDNFRSPQASFRQMLVVYNIAKSRFNFIRDEWGHPAWSADSRLILNKPNVYDDAITGAETKIPNLPEFPGQHLGFSPDGKLFVTDTHLEPFGGKKGEWGVAVCDIRGGDWVMIAKFQGDQGADTWRKNHPHPVFSPDGKRIYYNVNSGEFTTLYVAERGDRGLSSPTTTTGGEGR